MAQTEMADYVFVEPPDDSAYADPFTWERVDIEIVDEAERVFHFEPDEYLNVWTDRED
jgi:hypothetical protein